MHLVEKLENKRTFGPIFGDIIGSRFTWHNRKSKEFTMFHEKSMLTDDSILTLAVMDCFNAGIQDNKQAVIKNVKQWGRSFPNSGFGYKFKKWLCIDSDEPYGSIGNGAAMRISPVGWYAKDEAELDKYVELFTNITHNTPQALKAAKCIAMCVFMAKNGSTKDEIVSYIKTQYNIDFDYETLVREYQFDDTCDGSVPQALFCFAISKDLEDCARIAVSIGGETDTICSISCGIAAAVYSDGEELLEKTELFTQELADIVNQFNQVCAKHNEGCAEDLDSNDFKEEIINKFNNASPEVLSLLSEKEKMIMQLHLGLNKMNKSFSYEEIADTLKLTADKAQWMMSKAIRKLQDPEKFFEIRKHNKEMRALYPDPADEE